MPLDTQAIRTTSTTLPDEHRLFLARLQKAQSIADLAANRAAAAAQLSQPLTGWLLVAWATEDDDLRWALQMIGTNQVAGRACRENRRESVGEAVEKEGAAEAAAQSDAGG